MVELAACYYITLVCSAGAVLTLPGFAQTGREGPAGITPGPTGKRRIFMTFPWSGRRFELGLHVGERVNRALGHRSGKDQVLPRRAAD
jgi:hypothetical protein